MTKNSIPQFESDSEYLTWAFQQLSEGLKNLGNRVSAIEGALQKMPPPGADMIKYRIPEQEDYSNLAQVFDDLYTRLNKLES
tara:strand:+ start:149 stop:394 length:246 start_codon:yes stop_codon:yes gene_type:complete